MPFTPLDYQKIQKMLWNTSLFWLHILFVSEDAYGTEYFPLYLEILYKCNFDCLKSKKYCEAIMDDLLLFTPSKKSHMDKLKDLLKALLKNGLKISPKKCQLFKTNLQYIGNEIFIQNKRVCMQPLRSRLEAIQKLHPPLQSKGAETLQGWLIF